MAISNSFEQTEPKPPDALDVTISLDPHRAGLSRARLVEEGIPIWALIGNMDARNGEVDEEDIVQTAGAYMISEEAVRAAVAFYRLYYHAIDTFLDENTLATGQADRRWVWNAADGLREVD